MDHECKSEESGGVTRSQCMDHDRWGVDLSMDFDRIGSVCEDMQNPPGRSGSDGFLHSWNACPPFDPSKSRGKTADF